MPIYEEEGKLTTKDLLALRKRNKCKECGGMLNVFVDPDSGKAFLACNDWHRTHHEGIEREASRYEKEGLASLNIPTRRKIMTTEYGTEKTTALDKYMGVVSLTKPQAMEIMELIWPKAPIPERTRAAMLCASYGLNPLAQHVYLIPFNEGKEDESWSTVIGIKAKRLLASRRKNYSYLDMSPRLMTEEEQKKVWGKVRSDQVCFLTHLKDMQTGAEVFGFGIYPKDKEPKGIKYGNTQENMAGIRSESQGLDRLCPGEMPAGFEVEDERFIEAEYREVKEESEEPTGDEVLREQARREANKPKEHWCEEHNCPFEKKTRGTSTWYAHKLPGGGWCNEAKKKDKASKAAPYISENVEDLPSDEPKEPSPNTIEDLRETMQLCNWSAMEVGHFCNAQKGWNIRDFKDLTLEQVAEVIEHIKRNPK